MIKYYGGKTWLKSRIEKLLPLGKVDRIIDLFVGGGSITDKMSESFDNIIINDIDKNLINFYQQVKNNPQFVINYFYVMIKDLTFEKVKEFRKLLFEDTSLIDKAFMYYCCVYSGYGGKPYQSPTKWHFERLKRRNIERDINAIYKTISKCELHNEDYRNLVYKNCFYYCDPPYCKVGDKTYYGNKGEVHKQFDHLQFFNWISNISKNNFVIISYEDSQFIRELYKDWIIIKIDKKTTNYNPKTKLGETLNTPEVLIMNYDINKLKEEV